MGVHCHAGTMEGGLTPICNRCMITLCWDISEQEYEEHQKFWDAWICEECNGGEKFSKSFYEKYTTKEHEVPFTNDRRI